MASPRTIIINLVLILITFIGLVSSANAQWLTSKCVFVYQDNPLEWLQLQNSQFMSFTAINDSGQVIAEDNGSDQPVVWFYDSDSFNGRIVTAYYQYAGEYDSIAIDNIQLNNDGEVFGNVWLANNAPADEPTHQFHYYSNQFVFKWDLGNGFVDLASVVGGITGRSDIGASTALSGSTLITEAKTTDPLLAWGPQSTKNLPYPIRQPQNYISGAMLDEIQAQCGSAPNFNTNPPNLTNTSNSNFEFITARDLVRIPSDNIQVSLSPFWNGAGGNNYAGSVGDLGDLLLITISLHNAGAIDVYSLSSSIEVVGDFRDAFGRMDTDIFGDAPNSLEAGERNSDNIALLDTLKPGTYQLKVTVSGLDEFDKPFERSRTIDVTILSSEPELQANFSFSDGRSTSDVGLNETFGLDLTISATEGDNPLENIVLTDPFSGALNLEVVSGPDYPEGGYTIEPTKSQTLKWMLKSLVTGDFQFETTVTGIDNFGVTKSDSALLNGTVLEDDLEVTITSIPSSLILDDPDKDSSALSARCRELEEGAQDENNPITNCIEITTTIKNTSDKTLTNVNVQGLTDGLYRGLSISSNSVEFSGIPLTFIELEPAAGTQAAPLDVTLAAGESANITWRFNAYHGPAFLRFRALVTGSENGNTITSLGETDYTIHTLADVETQASHELQGSGGDWRVTYTAVLTNVGSQDAENVKLEISLPDQLHFESVSDSRCAQGGANRFVGGKVICTGLSLAATGDTLGADVEVIEVETRVINASDLEDAVEMSATLEGELETYNNEDSTLVSLDLQQGSIASTRQAMEVLAPYFNYKTPSELLGQQCNIYMDDIYTRLEAIRADHPDLFDNLSYGRITSGDYKIPVFGSDAAHVGVVVYTKGTNFHETGVIIHGTPTWSPVDLDLNTQFGQMAAGEHVNSIDFYRNLYNPFRHGTQGHGLYYRTPVNSFPGSPTPQPANGCSFEGVYPDTRNEFDGAIPTCGPALALSLAGSCPTIPNAETINVEGPVELLVTNKSGQKVQTLNGEIVIQEVSMRSMAFPQADGSFSWTLLLPKDEYDIELMGTTQGSYKLTATTYNDKGEAFSSTADGNTETGIMDLFELPTAPEDTHNTGYVNPEDQLLYACVRILEGGDPATIDGVDQWKITFSNPGTGSINLISAQAYNHSGNPSGNLMPLDCSGSFEVTTGIYTDSIRDGPDVSRVIFKLQDPQDLLFSELDRLLLYSDSPPAEPAYLDGIVLTVPAVRVGTATFRVELELAIESDPITLNLAAAEETFRVGIGASEFKDGILYIPSLLFDEVDYRLELLLVNDNPIVFQLKEVQVN